MGETLRIRDLERAAARNEHRLLATLRAYFYGVSTAWDDDRRRRNAGHAPIDVEAMAIGIRRSEQDPSRCVDGWKCRRRGKARVDGRV